MKQVYETNLVMDVGENIGVSRKINRNVHKGFNYSALSIPSEFLRAINCGNKEVLFFAKNKDGEIAIVFEKVGDAIEKREDVLPEVKEEVRKIIKNGQSLSYYHRLVFPTSLKRITKKLDTFALYLTEDDIIFMSDRKPKISTKNILDFGNTKGIIKNVPLSRKIEIPKDISERLEFVPGKLYFKPIKNAILIVDEKQIYENSFERKELTHSILEDNGNLYLRKKIVKYLKIENVGQVELFATSRGVVVRNFFEREKQNSL